MSGSFNLGIGVLVFIAYVIVDALYARYTLAVADLHEWSAATTGVLIHFLLAFGVVNYTQNYWYIFPLVAGSWLGTFLSVRRERLKRQKG